MFVTGTVVCVVLPVASAFLSASGLARWRYHRASSVAPSAVTTLWWEVLTLLAAGCAWSLK
jgi:hypothetical protein